MDANSPPRTPDAAFIERILKAKGWTLTELARQSGVAPSTLTRPVNDARHPFKLSRTTLLKLAEASGVPIPPGSGRSLPNSSVNANAFPDKQTAGAPPPVNGQGDGRGPVVEPSRLRIAAGGGIEVPETLVSLLRAEDGDALVARVEDGVLTIETVDNALRRVRASVRRHIPEGVSMVDALIAERRAEAALD